ncbi:hypothetical protein GCM10008956_14840 [Deinococcus arenae]|uniref:Uncharacterized protein n=1 Tax=Deinococcus arenae TaxID=1452751 RepID=A0A8H9GRW2_9DEIO|nr:hypothetical protein [Deinococcus arenae]AWT36408.1 hypothetical protein DM785_13215 [Deinococcus actinosclerus]GGM39448.1 hypothetical protein GCM10008956_14840 [Deinococcus arenae]
MHPVTARRTALLPILLLIPAAALALWIAGATFDAGATGALARTLRYVALSPLLLITVNRLPWPTFALLACGWMTGVLTVTAALAGSVHWMFGAPALLLALACAAGFILLRR